MTLPAVCLAIFGLGVLAWAVSIVASLWRDLDSLSDAVDKYERERGQ